jgi:ABC-type branched-subunit amino acid transport system ATPase component
MKQILRLFLHLYFKPKVIYLDEPFLYLSPTIRIFFQNVFEDLSCECLIFITDQKFSWEPSGKVSKINLGPK